MRYLLVAALFAVTASVASAAQLKVDVTDTVGNAALKTYKFSILTEGGETFRGVDASFTGAMNQVNPVGQASIFQDANAFFGFVGADVSQDSQFTFASSSLLQIGGAENANLLKAAISGLADNGLANPALFAQIAAGNPANVNVSLAFDLGGAQPVSFSGTIASFLIPEPTTCVLAGLALVGAATRRRV
jgi:hypothetical protein